MTVYCNAGTRVTNLQGDLPGYPHPVWYCPHAIANVLSLSDVSNIPRWRVTYSSVDGNRFVVTKADGSQVVFRNSGGLDGPSGLYCYDAGPAGLKGTMLINTDAENKSKYT